MESVIIVSTSADGSVELWSEGPVVDRVVGLVPVMVGPVGDQVRLYRVEIRENGAVTRGSTMLMRGDAIATGYALVADVAQRAPGAGSRR